MTRGRSLHVGLNQFDPAHYGNTGDLAGAEGDALAMQALADTNGFEPSLLLTADATRDAVRDAVTDAASQLEPGDIFWLSYAGHGSQVEDQGNDEDDFYDETWCLYDAQLIDDELNALWHQFSPGVRVLVVSDSCHSGSVTRGVRWLEDGSTVADADGLPRALPRMQADSVYDAHRDFYDELTSGLPGDLDDPPARVRLLSGCQDHQLSYDGPQNGLFTSHLLRVWDDGTFDGSYDQLHDAILGRMPDYQTPNHKVIGGEHPEFDTQRPFTV